MTRSGSVIQVRDKRISAAWLSTLLLSKAKRLDIYVYPEIQIGHGE